MPLRVSSLPLMASVGPFALEPAAHLESPRRTDPKGQLYRSWRLEEPLRLLGLPPTGPKES